jgi:3-O-alpha-D-mannopyranosyl-alpha-D-mannopyranose xylosylphosphotransferase
MFFLVSYDLLDLFSADVQRDLSPTDFHHPLLGPVFRLAPDPGLRVSPLLLPHLVSDPGEWGALQHANYLLSNRFYSKNRMYMAHVPKSMSLSLSHEASIMFADALALSATRGFRESKRGSGDVHFNWLVTHLHIERWREALLWSWAVAKLGGQDGMWRDTEKDLLRETLGFGSVSPGDLPDNVVIVSFPRSTMVDMDEIMEKTEWPFPQGSNYVFCESTIFSQDVLADMSSINGWPSTSYTD